MIGVINLIGPNSQVFATFNLTGSYVNNTGYVTIPVKYVNSNGEFSTNQDVILTFDQYDSSTGTSGSSGSPPVYPDNSVTFLFTNQQWQLFSPSSSNPLIIQFIDPTSGNCNKMIYEEP